MTNSKEVIAQRLPLIFSEGIDNRIYCVRDIAASTVFAALYIGAIEGSGTYFGPVHVYRMTQEQSVLTANEHRHGYNKAVLARKLVEGARWYADNSREGVRDETLRDGLVPIGAVIQRSDLPTTSGAPTYALKSDFAALFDPSLEGDDLEEAIGNFQTKHLSKSAQTKLAIIRAGATSSKSGVLVAFPNEETRRLAPGPSSVISKAVIEIFAPAYLENPAVLWLSESGNKVVFRDDRIATQIGLKIEPDKNLPDLILADLGPDDPLIVFVEVVATNGAMTQRRSEAIYALTDAAGFDRQQVVAISAYQDRQSAGFKRTVTQVSWGSLAWFVSEPDHIVSFHSPVQGKKLSAIIAAL
jgi:hypothetical protein